ncbi:MAG: ATP-binding cassette domain-containing protein [Myxococcota bacterium]|nr:ATP-binding cassette domain-containing protein [Myxococcales bacterium]
MTGAAAPESAAREAHVELRDVRVSFGSRAVIQGLSCSFPRGRVSVLMGGSGTGKSTLLRVVAGLLTPQSGSVRVAGDEIVGLRERELASVRTRLGMLFQNGALLDSLSVFDNVALPLRERTRRSEAEIRDLVHEHLTAVGLDEVDDLLPRELSGGMLKRAALARAIVLDPEILLCDEPFSGLDPVNVLRIEALLTRLSDDLGLTVIMTSHHVPSSRRMADQITVLFPDSAVTGSPRELAASSDERVAPFLGVRGEAGGEGPLVELG